MIGAPSRLRTIRKAAALAILLFFFFLSNFFLFRPANGVNIHSSLPPDGKVNTNERKGGPARCPHHDQKPHTVCLLSTVCGQPFAIWSDMLHAAFIFNSNTLAALYFVLVLTNTVQGS